MLDKVRLQSELTHIHWILSGVAASTRGKELVEELRREIGGTTAALIWQALFADCLRVVHCAISADGVIGDDEIDALYELVFSVARSYAAVIPDVYGDFDAIDDESIRAFLERYASDSGPFGRGAKVHWPGFTLCRRAAEGGEPKAFERYERMMTWFIGAACQIGGVTESDPRWQGRVDELSELRRTLARETEMPTPPEADLRVKAFLAPTRVFSAVQQPSSIYEADPFDVEEIHKDARDTFAQMVERAMSPSVHSDRGRILLVLGDSGAGKTHLLRGFRRYVHEYGRGFVIYAQLHSESEEYARYLLQHVVDSLARPYSGPSGERTGLHELASGLSRYADGALKARIDRLANETWDDKSKLAEYVNNLVDDLVLQSGLASFDNDLLRVLLYALHSDPRTTSRVYKYLRCEDMNEHDRRWIGGITPRLDKGDPDWMIRTLARLAFVTQRATFVLMLDQAELAGFEAKSGAAFRRAIDTLHGIVSEVPSAIAVVACLSDLYQAIRGEVTKSVLDRIERDPPVERLQINRSYREIEAIVRRRLAWLFAAGDAVYRPETPVYPIPEARLKDLVNRRTRDVLDWCHQFQAQCALAGKIIEEEEQEGIVFGGDPQADLDQIAAAWNDAMHASGIEVPDEDPEILDLVAIAARACADEAGLTLTTPEPKNGVLRIQLTEGVKRAEFVISVTNKSHHGGGFTGQIEALRKKSRTATLVAVRTAEFPRGPACDKALAQLLKGGGRRAYFDASTLRALVAFQRFRPAFSDDRVMEWRRRDRPISDLPAIAEIFDIGRLRAAESAAVTAVESSQAGTSAGERRSMGAASNGQVKSREPTPVKAALDESGPLAAASENAEPDKSGPVKKPRVKKSTGRKAGGNDSLQSQAPSSESVAAPTATNGTPPETPEPSGATPSQLHVGASTGFREGVRVIEVSSLLRHTGILGSSGSGKTTLALNLIEQALERDVAVVLVDRKGDLAGYAKPDWWQNTADPERARRLAERIDVRLFTPGTRGGRPLSMTVVPELEQVPEYEQDRMIQYAAQSLAAMMRLGDASSDTARRAILTQAISVLAGRKARGGLPQLIALVESRDDELVARAGRYDDKLFTRLVQDLENVRLNDADLFDPTIEPLTADVLIGRKPDGKVPLAIACTRFLGDAERVQSWVAHLIACLSRHVAKSPNAKLQTLFMIDEADLFMPAGAEKPPSKEPLQDLLKRARAAGLGVVLASQSPADFDYRSREQINTWFLGRIADKRSIDKMKPLFEHRPAVGGKLGNLEAGRFVLLQDGNAVDLERTPSLLRTEQIAETDLMTLAVPAVTETKKRRPRARAQN